MKEIDVLEVLNDSSINIIDVRETNEFNRGHLNGSKNIPMNTLINNHEELLNKECTYYIICQTGGRSQYVCLILGNLGYDVVNLVGGYSRTL